MKHLNSILILATLLLLSSCKGTRNSNELALFNNISFFLEENERIETITPQLSDDFQHYYQNDHFQVPLFRCIKGAEYTIFIGLPFNTNIHDLIEFQKLLQDSVISELITDNTSYYLIERKIGDDYYMEYAINCDHNLISILAVSQDKETLNHHFNYDKISNRLSSCVK